VSIGHPVATTPAQSPTGAQVRMITMTPDKIAFTVTKST
jgi:hypothetical protein